MLRVKFFDDGRNYLPFELGARCLDFIFPANAVSLSMKTEDLNRKGAKAAAGRGKDLEEPAANAMDEVVLSEWLFEIRSALARDMQPLAGDAANLSEVLAVHFAEAFLGYDVEPEPAANVFNPFQSRDLMGRWDGDSGGGSTSRRVQSIPEVVHVAFSPSNQTFCDWADVSASDVELIKREFGLDLTN